MVSTLRKGNAWRRKVEVALLASGFQCEVRGIGRPGDDITVFTEPPLSVEVKNHRSYDLAGWVRQAVSQAPRGAVPVVWAHRAGKASAEDGYVILTGRDFLRLLREVSGV